MVISLRRFRRAAPLRARLLSTFGLGEPPSAPCGRVRPDRRLQRGGLPVSPGVRRFVTVALAACAAPAHPGQRNWPVPQDCRCPKTPLRLSPDTVLCAVRTFLWHLCQRPSRAFTRIRLSKGRTASGAGGVRLQKRCEVVPKEGFEPSRPNGHYALNVARLPIPPLRHEVEPTIGFEPMTCCLRNSCSAAELRRPFAARILSRDPAECNGTPRAHASSGGALAASLTAGC